MPLLNRLGEWLLVRGIDASQPGWFWIFGFFLFPIALYIFGLALVYEITSHLDVRAWLPPPVHWTIAVAITTTALIWILFLAFSAPAQTFP